MGFEVTKPALDLAGGMEAQFCIVGMSISCMNHPTELLRPRSCIHWLKYSDSNYLKNFVKDKNFQIKTFRQFKLKNDITKIQTVQCSRWKPRI